MDLWESPEQMAMNIQSAWLVEGDFNVILNPNEKLGGLPVTMQKTADFASCVNNCSLTKIRYTRNNFKWWNGRIEEDYQLKRLDRIFRNQKFMNIFPASEVHHLIRKGSDHTPLHLVCDPQIEPSIKPFKFLNFSTKYQNFKELIKEQWKLDYVANPLTEFHAKMKKVKVNLKEMEKGHIW